MKVKYIPRSKNSSGANVIVDNNGRIYSKGRAGYKTKGAAKRAAKRINKSRRRK